MPTKEQKKALASAAREKLEGGFKSEYDKEPKPAPSAEPFEQLRKEFTAESL